MTTTTDRVDVGRGLTREERETHIWLSDAGETLTISTASPVFARKLEKLCMSLGITPVAESESSIRATLPVACLRLNKPIRLSDAERERRAAALRARRTDQS